MTADRATRLRGTGRPNRKLIMRQTRLALALSVAFITSAQAESLPEFVGDTIVVTPTRFPQNLSGQTASTTVITRQDIANSPQATLPEILAQQAGIGMRDLFGNNASASTVDMRGFGAAAGQNTLILLDGRRLNDIDLSAVDWAALPLSAIERIEIVRGGSSVLHGSGAVAGVINIITRSPLVLQNQVSGKVQAGSFNTRDYQLTGNYSGERGGIRLTADHYRSDGWRDNNDNTQSSLNGDARFKHELGELVFKFGGSSQDVRLPGPRTVEPDIGLNQLETDPQGTSTPLDWAKRRGYQAGLSNRFEFGRNELMLDLDYRNKQQQSYFDFGGYPDYRDAVLDMCRFSPRMLLPFETGEVAHSLAIGVDFQWWNYALRISNAEANVGTPINRVTADQNTIGLYARDEMQLNPDTRLTLGGRYEWFEIKAEDQYDATAPGAFGSGALPGSQDEPQYALELGVNHQLNPQHALFARLARSFRFATVDEIYEYSPSFSHEFQFLKPQTSQDAQVGWEWGAGPDRLRAAAYYIKVKDEIHLDVYSTGIGNTNLPPLQRYGLELEAHGRVSAVDLNAAYTLTYAQFTDGALNGIALEGKDVPLVPQNKLSLGALWHITEQTRLSVDASYVSSQLMENDETNRFEQRIPAYTLVDLKLMRQIGNWQLAVAVNNLFDQDYYTYAVHSPTNADRFNAYPLSGRKGWVSVEYVYK
jgi:iron complex outermembrane receptor protein